MKKYKQLISKLIKDFAEKGLLNISETTGKDIRDYFYNLSLAVVRSHEAENPKFVLDEAMKANIADTVFHQWNSFKNTKNGIELIYFFKNKNKLTSILEATERLNEFLASENNNKMISALFKSFIEHGNLSAVKKMVESSKIKADLDSCVLATEFNNPYILNYLFNKDKYQIKNATSYFNIYAKKAMDAKAHDVFNFIMDNYPDVDKDNLLSNAIFYKNKDFAYKLVDLGAKLKVTDPRVDKEFFEDVTSYYNKKIVHDNLTSNLELKINKKSSKI